MHLTGKNFLCCPILEKPSLNGLRNYLGFLRRPEQLYTIPEDKSIGNDGRRYTLKRYCSFMKNWRSVSLQAWGPSPVGSKSW